MLKPIWPTVKTLLLATVCIAATPTHDAYADRMCCPSRVSVIMPDDECACGQPRPRLCREWNHEWRRCSCSGGGAGGGGLSGGSVPASGMTASGGGFSASRGSSGSGSGGSGSGLLASSQTPMASPFVAPFPPETAATPGPIAGTGLPGLIALIVALGLRRRRVNRPSTIED